MLGTCLVGTSLSPVENDRLWGIDISEFVNWRLAGIFLESPM